jgi:tRNA1(Val) A37 N6-methylase TrmN6
LVLGIWNFNLRTGPRRRPYVFPRHALRMDLMDELLTTSDTFYHGKVLIQQLKKGYRFAVDSPILADFLPSADTPALEIGCGVGVVSLLALYRDKFPAITGVEIQESLYRLAMSNALANGMGERFQVVPGDFIEVCARFENIQTFVIRLFSRPVRAVSALT